MMTNNLSGKENEVLKANLCLVGIILIFLVLVLLAYLMTEGRSYCIIPLLRLTYPQCEWVVEHDEMLGLDYQRLVALKMGMSQHVLGVKRTSRQV